MIGFGTSKTTTLLITRWHGKHTEREKPKRPFSIIMIINFPILLTPYPYPHPISITKYNRIVSSRDQSFADKPAQLLGLRMLVLLQIAKEGLVQLTHSPCIIVKWLPGICLDWNLLMSRYSSHRFGPKSTRLSSRNCACPVG